MIFSINSFKNIEKIISNFLATFYKFVHQKKTGKSRLYPGTQQSMQEYLQIILWYI
jgi:hypothetical protein